MILMGYVGFPPIEKILVFNIKKNIFQILLFWVILAARLGQPHNPLPCLS